MKTLKKVPYKPVFVVNAPEHKDMIEGEVYISEEFGCAIHKCLCGCGNETVMPFSDADPKKWKLVKEKDGSVSFIGSVGNFQIPCKSHYVMTKNVANFL